MSNLQNNTIVKCDIKTDTVFGEQGGLRTYYSNHSYNDTTKIVIRISVLDVDNSITAENFQYEPYYITDSTKVVRSKNHTLTAIWKPNP